VKAFEFNALDYLLKPSIPTAGGRAGEDAQPDRAHGEAMLAATGSVLTTRFLCARATAAGLFR